MAASQQSLVVRQTCGFLTGGSSRGSMRFPLPFEVKELGKIIKVKFGDAATSFLLLRQWDIGFVFRPCCAEAVWTDCTRARGFTGVWNPLA